MKDAVLVFGCALWLSWASTAIANEQNKHIATPSRPKVALVLSGGGARGFAHIGVLKVLQEARIPVDLVWGTSMGSVVGGAYAAGRSAQELQAFVSTVDWDGVLADRPPRETLSARRREEDILLPSRVEFSADAKGLSLPPAQAGNAALELALTRLLPEGMQARASRDLPIPFGSVGSDLVTGELVDLGQTPVLQALRASLSVPGVFTPVRVQGRLLADGGLVRNLPVDLARSQGADVIIAVNVGTGLAPEEELNTSLGVARQMLNILTEQNVQRSLAELRPQDILIAPDLSGISFLDFKSHERAIQAGEAAARRLLDRLRPYAVPQAQWQAWLDQRGQALAGSVPQAQLPLAQLRFKGLQAVDERVLTARARLQKGQPVSIAQAHETAARLLGHGDLSRVEVEIADQAGQREITFHVTEASWARSRLRLGLELSSDFEESSSFALAAMHVLSLNRMGGELRTLARIGTQRELSIEGWQPLGATTSGYASLGAYYQSSVSDVFGGNARLGRIEARVAGLEAGLGYLLPQGADLRLSVIRGTGMVKVLFPQERPVERGHATQLGLKLRWDTLDSPGFPTRGFLVDAQSRMPLGEAAAQGMSNRQVQLLGLWAYRNGSWAGHVYGEYAQARLGSAPSSLGGFWRLTGTPSEAISGEKVVFARWVTGRTLLPLSPALGSSIRGGFSLEMGGGFLADQSVRWGGLSHAASAFVSADTRFGPIYLALGGTRGSSPRLYLFLGPVW